MSLSHGQHDLPVGGLQPIELPDVSISSSTKHPAQVRRARDGIDGRAVRSGDGGDDVVALGHDGLGPWPILGTHVGGLASLSRDGDGGVGAGKAVVRYRSRSHKSVLDLFGR